MHLPLQGGPPLLRRVGHLLVDGLAPADVALLLQQDVLQDADGGAVRHRVRHRQVVPVVDRQVGLQHAVEPHHPQQGVRLELQLLHELHELLVGRLRLVGDAEGGRHGEVQVLRDPELRQALAQPEGVDGVVVAVLAEGELQLHLGRGGGPGALRGEADVLRVAVVDDAAGVLVHGEARPDVAGLNVQLWHGGTPSAGRGRPGRSCGRRQARAAASRRAVSAARARIASLRA